MLIYTDKECWQGEEVIINNNLPEEHVTLYHGTNVVGKITNELTMLNILCQIYQKYHDEVIEQSMEWVDYYIVTSDGKQYNINPKTGRIESDSNIYSLYTEQLKFLLGF